MLILQRYVHVPSCPERAPGRCARSGGIRLCRARRLFYKLSCPHPTNDAPRHPTYRHNLLLRSFAPYYASSPRTVRSEGA